MTFFFRHFEDDEASSSAQKQTLSYFLLGLIVFKISEKSKTNMFSACFLEEAPNTCFKHVFLNDPTCLLTPWEESVLQVL